MGVGIVGDRYRWPNRTIPYVIDPALPDPQRVLDAVKHWNDNTVVRFKPRAAEVDYVLIARLPGAATSDVGRQGGKQVVALGDGCSVGSIIHELGHAVGLWHEHCRSDRDQWISIDFSNIKDGYENNFEVGRIAGTDTAMIDLGDYDYGSIMHYPLCCFPIDKECAVITTLKPVPAGVEIGQRVALSAGDRGAVARLYGAIGAPAAGPVASSTGRAAPGGVNVPPAGRAPPGSTAAPAGGPSR